MSIDQRPRGPAAASTGMIVDLEDEAALDPAVAGGKAAALARARRAGFATLPATVLTTALSERYDAGAPIDDTDALEVVLAERGAGPLVVRSSSVVEDQSDSSKAGQFESVLNVNGLDQLRAAVIAVLDSRTRAGAAGEPIAVLVQPMVDPALAGVAFGVDPVSGRSDRRLVTAVHGTPDRLVSGEVDGSRYVLDERARVVESTVDQGVEVPRSTLAALVDLGDRLAAELGGPQDVEWAQVGSDLLVLQSRPVTTTVRGVPSGPVYGPGPVAETFPEPLRPLEIDLWVPPLRDAVREALRLSGAVREEDLAGRELVVTVDGRVAIDLELTGEISVHHSFWWRTGARVRRLRSAWRIGRLRVALPVIAHDLWNRVDDDLDAVPPLSELSARQLVALIGRGQDGLRSLHAHEILLGLIADPSASSFTGASVALRLLVESRRDGLTDAEIVRQAPAVLALVPPKVGRSMQLPEASSAIDLRPETPAAAAVQVSREALRLRVRWMQELLGRAAYEIGVRLVERGELRAPGDVAALRFDDVAAVVAWQTTVNADVLPEDRPVAVEPEPLPARFQLSDTGMAVAVFDPDESGGGTGAGGGVSRGPVTHDAEHPPEGSVLVVGALTPQLGPLLPRLAGIVAETGSVLSHLAILARESGVATVVGHPGARQELEDGALVTVDGNTGRVTVEEAT